MSLIIILKSYLSLPSILNTINQKSKISKILANLVTTAKKGVQYIWKSKSYRMVMDQFIVLKKYANHPPFMPMELETQCY